jgi:hypothetical protein
MGIDQGNSNATSIPASRVKLIFSGRKQRFFANDGNGFPWVLELFDRFFPMKRHDLEKYFRPRSGLFSYGKEENHS